MALRRRSSISTRLERPIRLQRSRGHFATSGPRFIIFPARPLLRDFDARLSRPTYPLLSYEKIFIPRFCGYSLPTSTRTSASHTPLTVDGVNGSTKADSAPTCCNHRSTQKRSSALDERHTTRLCCTMSFCPSACSISTAIASTRHN